MSMWTCVKRWLSQATCDKTELNRKIIRIKKCFDEANDVVIFLCLNLNIDKLDAAKRNRRGRQSES